ncbi:MAG: hypothetical protein GX335_09230 [Firmicutes bacterium]|nr:hypothetical protein [Bacillota bacterium]
MPTGTLKVTFYNTYRNSRPHDGRYHFILYRVCDPTKVLRSFEGELEYGEQKTHTVQGLKPGNYFLVGLKLPDPKPGNVRNHSIMIYPGLETVYDVCYLRQNFN